MFADFRARFGRDMRGGPTVSGAPLRSDFPELNELVATFGGASFRGGLLSRKVCSVRLRLGPRGKFSASVSCMPCSTAGRSSTFHTFGPPKRFGITLKSLRGIFSGRSSAIESPIRSSKSYGRHTGAASTATTCEVSSSRIMSTLRALRMPSRT